MRGKYREPRPADCSECGTAFQRFSHPEVTCSELCRIKRRDRRKSELRATRGCARCGEVKPLSEYSTGGTVYCRECFNAWRREHVTAADHRRRMLKQKYKLTEAAFEAMLHAQGGRCAICREEQPSGRGAFHVDHDRACCPGIRSCGECVRSLLCARCNPGIGNFRENPEFLRAAADYVERWRRAAGEPAALVT
jgi:hypothetical protein